MARLCFFALMQEPDIEMVGAREGRAEDHLRGQAAALHRTGLQRGAHRADMVPLICGPPIHQLLLSFR
ncbi:MAG: hypothetical protein WA280_22605 [Xanthobacteraceae bacterium]